MGAWTKMMIEHDKIGANWICIQKERQSGYFGDEVKKAESR